MSSNAFARSRPRVRHQRVPRTHSCDHPRFLQLVTELARINEAKKKQEEVTECSSSTGGALVLADTCASYNDESARGSSSICPGISSSNLIATTNNNCCANIPQTSNGYRSLDANQSTSALHDNYQHYQQQQHSQQLNHHHHFHHHNHSHHHNHVHNHHHHHHQPPSHHQNEPQHISNTIPHQQNLDDRCCSKTGSSTVGFTGYSKQNFVVDQSTNSSEFSNNNSSNVDLRQDENRSKRKRSANDLSSSSSSSTNSRKNASCGGGGALKKPKQAPDAIRPLSPSFTKCPICLLDCMDRDPSFTNTCFHLFCYVCIENWTKNKATCPLCRTKFTKIIYNIKSATNYEEKIASPIRRDDDDGLIADRLMLDHLSSLNSNTTTTSRTTNSEEVQFLFENLRNSEVLMPQNFVNQMDTRSNDSLHFFNTVTTSGNFNSNVPHPPQFTSTSYPITPNYIALFHSTRLAQTTSTAIAGNYPANASLTNINTDPSNRRLSRSGRLVYPRTNYDPSGVNESFSRVSRTSTMSATNGGISQPSGLLPVEHQHQHQHHHHHHHQQPQYQHQNHHLHSHHPHNQHRTSTLDLASRLNQRLDPSRSIIQVPYPIPRHYNPQTNARRSYSSNPQVEHHLDSLHRQMPDM